MSEPVHGKGWAIFLPVCLFCIQVEELDSNEALHTCATTFCRYLLPLYYIPSKDYQHPPLSLPYGRTNNPKAKPQNQAPHSPTPSHPSRHVTFVTLSILQSRVPDTWFYFAPKYRRHNLGELCVLLTADRRPRSPSGTRRRVRSGNQGWVKRLFCGFLDVIGVWRRCGWEEHMGWDGMGWNWRRGGWMESAR